MEINKTCKRTKKNFSFFFFHKNNAEPLNDGSSSKCCIHAFAVEFQIKECSTGFNSNLPYCLEIPKRFNKFKDMILQQVMNGMYE
jgi:hypothetical protein